MHNMLYIILLNCQTLPIYIIYTLLDRLDVTTYIKIHAVLEFAYRYSKCVKFNTMPNIIHAKNIIFCFIRAYTIITSE